MNAATALPPARRRAFGFGARRATVLAALVALSGVARADPGGDMAAAPTSAAQASGAQSSGGELRAEVCRMIDAAAARHSLPSSFLTRLIWQESSFRPRAVSSAGARGIAQFMPGTAAERGLADPFDPEQAIPKAAEFLAELRRRFGNLGLAAAAYNGGPARVAAWLAGSGGLPYETVNYVEIVTRRPVEDWRSGAAAKGREADLAGGDCLKTAALIAAHEPRQFAGSTLTAPWGVQLSGSFRKAAALSAFARTQARFASVIGNVEPMVIGRRAPGRGFARFFAVRIPSQSRSEANALCQKIERAGGACAVLKT
jgi:hypothetical protein